MSRKVRDGIINLIVIIVFCIVAFVLGFKIGVDKHTKDSYNTIDKFYYGSIDSIARNTGIIRIKANNRIYEIGYSEKLIDGSSSVLIEIDDNKIVNVWNLAYNIEGD